MMTIYDDNDRGVNYKLYMHDNFWSESQYSAEHIIYRNIQITAKHQAVRGKQNCLTPAIDRFEDTFSLEVRPAPGRWPDGGTSYMGVKNYHATPTWKRLGYLLGVIFN